MIRIRVLRISFILAVSLRAAAAPRAYGQEIASVQQSINEAEAELRYGRESQAIRALEDALRRHPANVQLRVELGRAYAYQRQDNRAIEIFRGVLRDDSSNRTAKLELARLLSYEGQYDRANPFFRELLKADPGDEAAAIGLAGNLMRQGKRDEARLEVDEALAHHPNSLRLQEYRDALRKDQLPLPASRAENGTGRAQADATYFSDTAGNRAFRAGQRLDLQIGRRFSNSFRLDERSLWISGGPKANLFSFNDEGRVQLNKWFFVGAGVGAVRFADGANRALYRGGAIVHPFKNFWLQGGFSRTPVSPTYLSSQFDLLAEGWWSRLDWQPHGWQFSADFSKQHYSDSNRTQREDAEVLRWIGGPRFAVGLGYGYFHSSFTQNFAHGYFSPNQYHNHLALGGFRFGAGKFYRGEYIAQYGAESVDDAPYEFAWQATGKNRLLFGKWELGADYTYFRLAQSTGAFQAQAGRLSLEYRF